MGDDPNKPFVMPGEIISPEQREKLGANRLRRWFENGTLELADFVAPEPQRRLALQDRPSAPVAVLDPEEPKSYIRDESGKVKEFEPEQKGRILLPDNGGAVAVADELEQLDQERMQRRLDRNTKAREKRATDKAAKAKRDERNRKAREKRAAARVNGGE